MRRAFACFVIGRSCSRTIILGDADVMVSIVGDNIRTATITKANELAEGPLFSFKPDLHKFGLDEDGDAIPVNVVVDADGQALPSSEPRLSRNQQNMFSVLHEAGLGGLTTEQWNERAREAGLGHGRRADLYDFREVLRGKGVVRQYGDR